VISVEKKLRLTPLSRPQNGKNKVDAHCLEYGFSVSIVDLSRGKIPEALMGSLTVVKGEVRFQALVERGDALVVPKVDVLVFDAPPKPLHENVVQSSATAIHADTDARAFKCTLESHRSELDALITIKDLGLPLLESPVQGLEAEQTVKRIGQLPGDDKAGKPVHDRHQIHEPLVHPDIGDIRCPNVIGTADLKVTQ
jgi:hypothetical protein